MSSEPTVREQIQTILDWFDDLAALKEDQDFCRNFMILEETSSKLVLRHWSKAVVEVRLGAGGALAGWDIVSQPKEADPQGLTPARGGAVIRVRTWGELWAVVRADLNHVVSTEEGPDLVIVRSDGEQGPRQWRFVLDDRADRDPTHLGAGPGGALDAAQLVLLASALERGAPQSADPAADLRLAAACTARLLHLIDAGEASAAAITTAAGRALLERQPQRVQHAAARDELARQTALAAAVEAVGAPLFALLAAADAGSDALLRATRPQPGDVERAFRGDFMPALREAYAALWLSPPPFDTGAVVAAACTTEDFDAAAPATAPFAGGWRGVADSLAPGRVWVALSFRGAGRTRYEGFVWLDDHWAWFPKPWRMIPAAARRDVA